MTFRGQIGLRVQHVLSSAVLGSDHRASVSLRRKISANTECAGGRQVDERRNTQTLASCEQNESAVLGRLFRDQSDTTATAVNEVSRAGLVSLI